MKKLIFMVSSLLVFAVFNYAIYQKEQLKAEGEIVLLELAPVDPRSLMQGDYMQLRYKIGTEQNYQAKDKRGYLVVKLDAHKVATFQRFYQAGDPLATDEKLLRYHDKYGNVSIVPNSFMFQEGQAERYAQAKYGVFKFDNQGNHILVGLANQNLAVIQPE